MRRTVVAITSAAIAAGVGAAAFRGGASGQGAAFDARTVPILLRCPRPSDELYKQPRTSDDVIAMARHVNSREVTHYQGRRERRTAVNTPVVGLVMELADPIAVPGRRSFAARAVKRCGQPALAAAAVTFSDSLSPVCCQTFTLYVARGSEAWIVFKVWNPVS